MYIDRGVLFDDLPDIQRVKVISSSALESSSHRSEVVPRPRLLPPFASHHFQWVLKYVCMYVHI